MRSRAGSFRADVAVAALLVLVGVLEATFAATEGHSRTVTAIVAVVALAPVAWARRKPVVAIGLFMGVCVAQSALDSFFFETLAVPVLAAFYLLYLTGRHAEGRAFWVQVALMYGGTWIALPLTDNFEFPGDMIWVVFLFTAPLLAGRGVRSRVLLQREMRAKAERHEAERELRGRRAVEDERARIASELQAVVANGVSAMVVQADTVPRSVAAGDIDGAGQALAVVEETGRDALAEMRRLLGVLRRDDEDAALAPQPSLARAGALVDRVSGDGLIVRLEVNGDPAPLPAGVDLAAYRVLQEALDWVRGADGASSARVDISYGDRDVHVVVRDDRPEGGGPDPGSLHAMRERVGLYGGALRAGPDTRGEGFEVEARLPYGGKA